MPDRTLPHHHRADTGLRVAVIELMSRSDGVPDEDDLRALVASASDPVVSLRRTYDGGRHDPRGRVFATHAD